MKHLTRKELLSIFPEKCLHKSTIQIFNDFINSTCIVVFYKHTYEADEAISIFKNGKIRQSQISYIDVKKEYNGEDIKDLIKS